MSLFSRTVEVVEPTRVTDEMRLVEIQDRRRVADHAFRGKCEEVARQRAMLFASIRAMETARREFYAAQETEADELMRLGLRK
jgi:hypothetical protein